ncbi:MAG: BRCT domain-containing protein [Patescibacteria group bacterium]
MLASHFLKKLKNIKQDRLHQTKGLGTVLVNNFEDFLDSQRFTNLLSKFEELEQKQIFLEISTERKTNGLELPLSTEVICITGSFDLDRNTIKAKLEDLGAKVVNSITSKTTILLAGENAGSKIDKAKQKNIKILNNLDQLIGNK